MVYLEIFNKKLYHIANHKNHKYPGTIYGIYPGYFKNPVPPLCIVPTCIMYPRVQAKTPKICKIPGVLWPALYGILGQH